MFCGNCGNQINDNMRFCDKCGQPIQHAPTMSTNQNSQWEQPNQVYQNVQNVTYPNIQPMQSKQTTKQRKPMKIVLIALLVVALAGAGILTFFIIKGDNTKVGNSFFGQTKASIVEISDKKINLENEFFSVVSALEDIYVLSVNSVNYALFSGKYKSAEPTRNGLHIIKDISDEDVVLVYINSKIPPKNNQMYLSTIRYVFSENYFRRNVKLFNGLSIYSPIRDYVENGFLHMFNYEQMAMPYETYAALYVDGEIVKLDDYIILANKLADDDPQPIFFKYLEDKGIDLGNDTDSRLEYSSYRHVGEYATTYLSSDFAKSSADREVRNNETYINEVALYLACMDYGKKMINGEIDSYGVLSLRDYKNGQGKELVVSVAVNAEDIQDIINTLHHYKDSDDGDD